MEYFTNNPRITVKERNLIKGSIRRVFSRSELRKRIIELTIDKTHIDTTRKRVKTWCVCMSCKTHVAKSALQVDHVDPVVPLDKTLEEMSWDTVVDRIWCDSNNLQAICESCHLVKTSYERKERNKLKPKKGNKK